MFEVMLSSTKKISGFLMRRTSSTISSMGRRVCVFAKYDWIAQNSHRKWQPRPASTSPTGRYRCPAKLGGDLIRPFGGIGLDAERHQIRRFVERNRFRPVVVETNVGIAIARRHPGKRRRRERLHLPRADVRLSSAASDARMNERQPHR